MALGGAEFFKQVFSDHKCKLQNGQGVEQFSQPSELMQNGVALNTTAQLNALVSTVLTEILMYFQVNVISCIIIKTIHLCHYIRAI